MFRSLGLLLCLASLTLHIRGQDDFDLKQVFDDDVVDVTKKTPAAPTKPVDGPPKATPKPNPGGAGIEDFNLDDAFDNGDKGPETPKPQPGGGGGAGGGGHISDNDLVDGQPLPDEPKDRDYHPSADTEEKPVEEPKTSMIAGILGAVGAAALGAVSSFIAYQKKKLCFKESSGDPENVNMESYKGDQAEPQVQPFLAK
ncbi:uncharacterized protein LOC734619 isoform X1 [Xenopus laevis]|uniref:Uncharacterized protein LOC734619 isoform X1 n=1 Tax=Xenopus laevis TaxID=8355 RepID=A0A8J0UCJ1_XENLA|nr:uncharacterized protein LOC734619 isoform X1 [Xenopus laevis]